MDKMRYKTGPGMEFLALYLNRLCPRNCKQCEIADNSKAPMPEVEDWKEAILAIRDAYGVKFFLFLGTEPLVYGKKLVELVRWFETVDMFYGFYSTSPEPLFSRHREALVEAGLQNWSSGIDLLPNMKLDRRTEKKVKESMEGLLWMAERGVQTHLVTTVHKQNLHMVPRILEWAMELIPNIETTINFIEWKRGALFDFMSPKEDMPDLMWDGSPEEIEMVKKVCHRIKLLSRVYGKRVQVQDIYLENAHKKYLTIDTHCGGVIGPAMDCDGTMRLCAYSTGTRSTQHHAKDLSVERNLARFQNDWDADLAECIGCDWSVKYQIEIDPRILDPHSGFHEERWCLTYDEYKKLVKEDGLCVEKERDEKSLYII